jgi:hypothetical protein
LLRIGLKSAKSRGRRGKTLNKTKREGGALTNQNTGTSNKAVCLCPLTQRRACGFIIKGNLCFAEGATVRELN